MFVCLYLCLSCKVITGAPLPQLITRSSLCAASTTITTVTIVIIITTTRVRKSSKTINPLGILSHLPLEVPSEPDKLLILLYSGRVWEEDSVRTSVERCKKRKDKTRKRKRELTTRVPSNRVAHDVYVTSHCTLLSEAIQTIGINWLV